MKIAMTIKPVLPIMVVAALSACNTTPDRITNERIVAAIPEKMMLISINKGRRRANIVVLATSNKSIVTLQNQLETSGTIKAELKVLESLTVCDRSIRLAALQLNGDTSQLRTIESSNDQINHFLGVDPGDPRCASAILAWNSKPH